MDYIWPDTSHLHTQLLIVQSVIVESENIFTSPIVFEASFHCVSLVGMETHYANKLALVWQRLSCLCLARAGIKGVHHCASYNNILTLCFLISQTRCSRCYLFLIIFLRIVVQSILTAFTPSPNFFHSQPHFLPSQLCVKPIKYNLCCLYTLGSVPFPLMHTRSFHRNQCHLQGK